MKVRECLDRVRAIPGAEADEDMMLTWLNDCEGILFEEIISAREGCEEEVFDGYGAEDTEEILLAKDPYSVVYVYFVAAQIYLSYADMARYNNYLALYRDAYEEFAGYYARHHRQKSSAEVKL